MLFVIVFFFFFFFQAEDGIRDLVRSRGLGDVYKRQIILISGGFPSKSFAKGIEITARPSPSSSTFIPNLWECGMALMNWRAASISFCIIVAVIGLQSWIAKQVIYTCCSL